MEYLLDNYGFPENYKVKLKPEPHFRAPIELPEEKQQKLNKILQQNEAELVPLLEDIVSIVNDSVPKGTGCTEAGYCIRKILQELRIEDIIFQKETCGSVNTHDCTVVYNKEGNWVVLNSVSPDPNKRFYVVPKDKLDYMGPIAEE